MKKNILFFAALALLVLAVPAIAADVKTVTHILYENTFGPLGAVLGLFAITMLLLTAKKLKNQKGFVYYIVMVAAAGMVIESLAFGLHGFGLLGADASRYIERTTRIISLIIISIASFIMYKENRKK